MTKLMKYYNELKAEFLAENPRCLFHIQEREIRPGFRCQATQNHHSRGRVGTLLIDKRFFKGICDCGHHFVGDNPEMAREMGLLCKKGDWNRAPEDAETRRLRNIIKELTK
jgi:hypothetical protein